MQADPHVFIALVHIVFIVPLFMFVGAMRDKSPTVLYKALLVMGATVLGYHLWRLSVKYRSNVSGQWINLIHVALVAPLLIYIGINEKDTPRYAYEVLLMTGFAALGYHMITLIKSINAN
jgi:hypothetical protein